MPSQVVLENKKRKVAEIAETIKTAYACACVMLRILEDYSLLNLAEVEECFDIGIGHLTPDSHRKFTKNKRKRKHEENVTG